MKSSKNNIPLSDAKMMLEGLKKGFLEALPDRTDELELLVLSLNDATLEGYNELLRHVHSIKGSAGTYGIQTITKICHHFENHIESLNGDLDKITAEFINQSIKYVDIIRLAVNEASAGQPDYNSVEKELERVYEKMPSNRVQVLIAESSPSMAMIYKGALDDLSLEITMVSDGMEALELLLTKKYDFVITSKAVKTLNGAALISALRMSETANSQAKIILLSSSNCLEFGIGIKPDYVILKDSEVSDNLLSVAEEIIRAID